MSSKDETQRLRSVANTTLLVASVVVIIAGARFASPLLQPLLMSLFLAIIFGSPVASLRRRGLSPWFAAGLVAVIIVSIVSAVFVMFSHAIEQFHKAVPLYHREFDELLNRTTSWLSARGIKVSEQAVEAAFHPGRALSYFASFIGGVSGALSNIFLILFTVAFLLVDAAGFPRKLAANIPHHQHSVLAMVRDLVQSLNDYMEAKAVISLATALLVWLGLYLLEVDFAELWALLAFFLNFIPTIGSIIAAVPVVLLSVLDMDPLHTMLVVALYLGVNIVMGNVVEPAWMGRRVGLSTLTVFLSVIFWGWMFGAVGTLLSVPLTMVVKFVAERHPGASWLALLLSAPPPDDQTSRSLDADTPESIQ